MWNKILLFGFLVTLFLSGLLLGIYFYNNQMRCRRTTICILTKEVTIGGVRYKIDQAAVDSFVNKYKTSDMISSVWLWRSSGGDRYDLELVENIPFTINILEGSNGKVILGKEITPGDKMNFVKMVSVLGEKDKKVNRLFVYFDPETIGELEEEDLNKAFTDILAWTIQGETIRVAETAKILTKQ